MKVALSSKFFVALLLVMLLGFAPKFAAQAYGAAPDFAFPEKVYKSAEADLKAALKAKDGKATVNALIRSGLAKSQINTDSLPMVLQRIEEIKGRESDPATKALLNALTATIYRQIYDANRYTYRNRQTVADGGDDYKQWSREQFLDKVTNLVEASLTDADALAALPITDFEGIVTIDRQSTVYYPSLLDFIANNGIQNLQSLISGSAKVLNEKLLADPTDSSLYPGTYSRPIADILRIYSLLIAKHADRPAALYMAEVEAMQFVSDHLLNSEWQERSSSADDTSFGSECLKRYEQTKDSQYSGLFLINAAKTFSAGADAVEVCRALDDYADRFPNSELVDEVEYWYKRLCQMRANIEYPTDVALNRPFNVKLRSVNGKSVLIEMFDVTGIADVNESDMVAGRLTNTIDSKQITLEQELPFTAEQTVQFSCPKYGMYVLRLTVDGVKDASSCRIIRCSDMAIQTVNSGGSKSAWVVDALTGEPLKDVAVDLIKWSRRDKNRIQQLGVTDKNGELALNVSESGSVRGTKGDDRYMSSRYVSDGNDRYGTERLSVQLFTSLGLYRPGDEVEFALVAYTEGAQQRKIAEGQRLGVELMNVNYESVDTLVVVTDAWGRAEGKFRLPTSGLTGQFTLRAGPYDLSTKIIKNNGSTAFMVSDYKLPTFELKTENIQRPSSPKEGAAIEGRAVTFSGFPVANAAVKAYLTVRQGFWRWGSESNVFYTAETTTDEDGRFKAEIPATEISGSPAPNGLFVCKIDVTSEAGESQQMSATFNLGKPYCLQASVPSQINLASPFKASVSAVDANGQQQPLEVTYTVTADTDSATVASGRMMTGSFADVIAKLPVGCYHVKFAPVDEQLADATSEAALIVYRPTDSVCPLDTPLWVPSGDYTADEAGKVNVTVGSNDNDTHVRILMTTYPGKVVEKRWITLKKGMQQLSFTIPDGEQVAKISFYAVKNMQCYSDMVEVKAAAAKKSVKVEIESFRDKVTPGETEKITLRVKPSDGATAESAVFLDMSSKAIDLLASNPIQLPTFRLPSWYVRIYGWQFDSSSANVEKSVKYPGFDNWTAPQFEFYNKSFVGGGRNVVMRSRSYKSEAVMMSAMAVESAEVADEMVYDMADAGGSYRSDGTNGTNETNGSDETDESNGSEVYRPSEVPLAFFRPMLATAEDGSLEISYVVPDANTTWVLRAMAYNKELLTSSTSAEIVASKPLMVEENAPRFLRTADRVTLLSTIMNNSDSVQTVTITSELLSAATGKVIADSVTVVTLQPMSSATASLQGVAPVGETGLIYRVKAAAGDYVDGEQSLLPILPSEQDVVESEIFYIAPSQECFTLDLPAMADGDRAYLNFTENPAWQVVSALPGLRNSAINSSVEAASALYSAAVADGLMRDFPEVARTLRRWSENPSDSALVSSLQKNEELKAMLLSSTPWISEALSDTQRMQRLALLFDKRQTKAVIAEAIEQLARMRVDGGWSWTEKYKEVSRWATAVILDELGDLNRLGWLPSDARLQKMIKEGVEYFDRQAVKDFQRDAKAEYWHYVYIRDKFPNIKTSTAASRVVEAELQRALAQWKGSSVAMKGVYALILNAHGYSTTSRLILESLREYATESPEKGMWWQQLDRNFNLWSFNRVGATAIILDAFHSVEQSCADVEKIRQWLILNKTNNDWGNNVITSEVIASILTSGKPLTVNSRGTAIHIGDELLEPSSVEYATGAFTQQITSMLAEPRVMTIDRQADYPSVGGVVMMRRLPMDSVAAVSCQEVAVEKSLSVFDGQVWQPSSEFKVGDRVRVELTLMVEDDLSYVVIADQRAAGLEPVEQLPEPIVAEGLWFYRENRDSQTNIFIDFLPRGVYRLAYELFASQAGSFAGGGAQVQSQYNPIVAAHSGGALIRIN